MNDTEKRTLVVSAVAGGIVAGALLATKRQKVQTTLPLALTAQAAVALPALRAQEESPVIYEAQIETPKRKWIAWMCAPAAFLAGIAGTIFYGGPAHGNTAAVRHASAYHRTLHPAIRVVRLPVEAPVIRDFRLSAASARGGESIFAHYNTNAKTGWLRMTDTAGVVWLSRPLHGSGVQTIAVPRMHADAPFIVSVRAQRGGGAISASAVFVARGAAAPAAAAAPTVAQFALPSSVRGGATVAISVPASYAQATVSLSAADGTALLAPALQSQHRVILHIPGVAQTQHVFATLSYQKGKSKETLIRRVTIEP